jgi:hypothetical protein
MNVTLAIDAVGLCAEGLPDWLTAQAVLRGKARFDVSARVELAASALPATERRRANTMSRWALQVASEATRDLDPAARSALPTVFASADGDGIVLAQMLQDLSAHKVALSPTTFHNSVFNAPAGYWSIAAHAPAASTTICAAEGSFAAGLLEAAAQVADRAGSVLLVACDHPFPAHSPIATPARHALACALRLRAGSKAGTLGSIADIAVASGAPSSLPAEIGAAFEGNASAAGLVLLRAIACAQPARLRLPYTDGEVVELAWQPNG